MSGFEFGEACVKRKYSQGRALDLAASKKMKKLGIKRAYQCGRCGYWHLTSKDFNEPGRPV